MKTWELVQQLEDGVDKIRNLIELLHDDLAKGLKEGNEV